MLIYKNIHMKSWEHKMSIQLVTSKKKTLNYWFKIEEKKSWETLKKAPLKKYKNLWRYKTNIAIQTLLL